MTDLRDPIAPITVSGQRGSHGISPYYSQCTHSDAGSPEDEMFDNVIGKLEELIMGVSPVAENVAPYFPLVFPLAKTVLFGVFFVCHSPVSKRSYLITSVRNNTQMFTDFKFAFFWFFFQRFRVFCPQTKSFSRSRTNSLLRTATISATGRRTNSSTRTFTSSTYAFMYTTTVNIVLIAVRF